VEAIIKFGRLTKVLRFTNLSGLKVAHIVIRETYTILKEDMLIEV
jgi:hypothetical protein